MRKALFLLVLGVVLGSMWLPAPGIAGGAVGVRGGWSHASGDVFDGSGDPGSGGIYGFTVALGIVPMLDAEFAYERYTSDFDFRAASLEDAFFGGKASYDDQAYLLTGKLHLPLIGGMTGLGLYGGAGINLHRIDLSVKSQDEDWEAYAERISGEDDQRGWHLVGGVQWKFPAFPLALYGEYRYQGIRGSDTPNYSSIYAGLNLCF